MCEQGKSYTSKRACKYAAHLDVHKIKIEKAISKIQYGVL